MKTTIRIITIVCILSLIAACADKAPQPTVKTATSTEKYRPHGK